MLEGILILLGAFLAYLFGRWQGEHQLLYERRVAVIDELFNRFEDVDRQFSALFAPLGGGNPEAANQAGESFDALRAYFRRNSLWLPPRVSNQVNDFLARYREPFIKFTGEAMSQDPEMRTSERLKQWNDVWTAFKKDSPEIRQTLETEFRAALGSWRAKLAILLEYLSAYRQASRP
ncbi:MAG: hypothetical protein H0U04_17280 [Rubrobacter sp.]|nr:hypothetical protein [Rubrobacter sp.]